MLLETICRAFTISMRLSEESGLYRLAREFGYILRGLEHQWTERHAFLDDTEEPVNGGICS